MKAKSTLKNSDKTTVKTSKEKKTVATPGSQAERYQDTDGHYGEVDGGRDPLGNPADYRFSPGNQTMREDETP